MKKVILLFLTLLPLTSHALFYAGGYGQIGFSDLSDNPEAYNSTRDLNHGGWTLHAGIGGRLGISYMLVKAGIVGDYSKQQWEGEREDANVQSGFDGAEDYDNVFERTMYGAFVMVDLPAMPIYLIGEYYTKVKGQATYAQPVGENPFSQGDEYEGKGFGLGAGGSFTFLNTNAILRRIVLDKYSLSGVDYNLPGSQYKKKQGAWEFTLQFGIAVDLL
jgi:hypothetical protein